MGGQFDRLSVFQGTVASVQDTGGVESILLNIEGKAGSSGGMCVDVESGFVIGVFCGSFGHHGAGLTEEVQYARSVQYVWELVRRGR